MERRPRTVRRGRAGCFMGWRLSRRRRPQSRTHHRTCRRPRRAAARRRRSRRAGRPEAAAAGARARPPGHRHGAHRLGDLGIGRALGDDRRRPR
ncbi:MAG: hypothetical protein DCF31_14430 [Alphaproteobacteria bacterium]|nr:MAG: hypothetical protein DCF31_14430 [Alphaproteobacteria bacterium]